MFFAKRPAYNISVHYQDKAIEDTHLARCFDVKPFAQTDELLPLKSVQGRGIEKNGGRRIHSGGMKWAVRRLVDPCRRDT